MKRGCYAHVCVYVCVCMRVHAHVCTRVTRIRTEEEQLRPCARGVREKERDRERDRRMRAGRTSHREEEKGARDAKKREGQRGRRGRRGTDVDVKEEGARDGVEEVEFWLNGGG